MIGGYGDGHDQMRNCNIHSLHRAPLDRVLKIRDRLGSLTTGTTAYGKQIQSNESLSVQNKAAWIWPVGHVG